MRLINCTLQGKVYCLLLPEAARQGLFVRLRTIIFQYGLTEKTVNNIFSCCIPTCARMLPRFQAAVLLSLLITCKDLLLTSLSAHLKKANMIVRGACNVKKDHHSIIYCDLGRERDLGIETLTMHHGTVLGDGLFVCVSMVHCQHHYYQACSATSKWRIRKYIGMNVYHKNVYHNQQNCCQPYLV